MNIIPFEPRHLDLLALQPAQDHMRPYLELKDYGKWLAVDGKSYTGIDGERVLFCAGVMPLWDGRGEAWALLGGDIRRQFLKVHHVVLRFFDVCDIRRIEANVDADSDCAKRWITMLGFRFEGAMPRYWPDGRDALRFARVT